MSDTHDDDEKGGKKWVYHSSDGETRETVSEDKLATEQVVERVAASRYIPIVEYDRESKSISFTTRL